MNGHDFPELFDPTDEERPRAEDDDAAEYAALLEPVFIGADWTGIERTYMGICYRRGLMSAAEHAAYERQYPQCAAILSDRGDRLAEWFNNDVDPFDLLSEAQQDAYINWTRPRW